MRNLLLAHTIAILIIVAFEANAAAVRDQILSRADYFESSACAMLEVEFNLPARYVAHYPFAHGSELRIELDAFAATADDAKFERRREALEPPEESRDLISQIVYEGNTVPRPVLTIAFRRDVPFKLAQGPDFRSVVIAIPRPGGSGVCEPAFPDTE